LQAAWNSQEIYKKLYTSTKWCCGKKKYDHYGNGKEYVEGKAFSK